MINAAARSGVNATRASRLPGITDSDCRVTVSRPELESRLLASLRIRRDQRPQFSLSLLEDVEMATAAVRLSQLHGGCGCAAGAACMLAALLLGSLLALRQGASNGGAALTSAGAVLIAALVAAVLGKLVGMAVSKIRWRLERERLLRRLN